MLLWLTRASLIHLQHLSAALLNKWSPCPSNVCALDFCDSYNALCSVTGSLLEVLYWGQACMILHWCPDFTPTKPCGLKSADAPVFEPGGSSLPALSCLVTPSANLLLNPCALWVVHHWFGLVHSLTCSGNTYVYPI